MSKRFCKECEYSASRAEKNGFSLAECCGCGQNVSLSDEDLINFFEPFSNNPKALEDLPSCDKCFLILEPEDCLHETSGGDYWCTSCYSGYCDHVYESLKDS